MKTILITGASSGIGWDTVRVLVQNKHQVLAIVRKNEDASKLTAEFSDLVIPLVMDLSHFEQIDKLPIRLKAEFQIEKIDLLVNNAGVAFAGPFLDQDFDEIENIIRLNVLSVMKLTQVMLPFLGAKKNAGHAGAIINISSISGKSGAPFLSAYAASKHALEGFSDALRKELMLFGIKVIVIGPGSIKTPIWSKGFEMVQERYQKSLYSKAFKKFITIALTEKQKALEVSEISNLILKIVNSNHPSFRYNPIPRKWINWYIPQILPQRFYNYLTAKALGLK